MEQLTITEKSGANYALFELVGSCNSYTVGDLQAKIFETIKRTNVVLDLSQVITMDSTGMGMLFAGFNEGLTTGYKLYLMNMSFSVTNTVKETGFLEAFNVVQSVTEVQ
ncbi:STAS domain-containing protein [Treponema sp.]|uniref:STAS domain-containing protein n=1 Tax=Treponema sp. TaxID=166 RepID=UPI00298E9786|nr:STAS domain-containing protein [Treponema sp.]